MSYTGARSSGHESCPPPLKAVALHELVKKRKVIPGTYPTVGRAGIGLAARADAPVRDISTTEAFKQVLLGCDSLFYNNVASGDGVGTIPLILADK